MQQYTLPCARSATCMHDERNGKTSTTAARWPWWLYGQTLRSSSGSNHSRHAPGYRGYPTVATYHIHTQRRTARGTRRTTQLVDGMDQRRTHAVGDVCTSLLVQEHLARAGAHDERTGGRVWRSKHVRRDGGELQTA